MFLDLDPRFFQLGDDRLQMLADGVLNVDVAAGHRRRHHVRPRLNTVGNDRISGADKLRHPLDLDDIRPRAANICAHNVEIIGEIDNFRLLRRILQHRLPFGHGGRHNNILRRPNARKIEVDTRPFQAFRRLGVDVAVPDLNVRTQCFKAFQMKIDGARADGAAARQGNFRPPAAR